jgi:hypothetical protein
MLGPRRSRSSEYPSSVCIGIVSFFCEERHANGPTYVVLYGRVTRPVVIRRFDIRLPFEVLTVITSRMAACTGGRLDPKEPPWHVKAKKSGCNQHSRWDRDLASHEYQAGKPQRN